MLKHLGLDGWQAWDYAVARLYKRTETEEGISNMCDVCGSPNGNEHGMTCPIAIAEALMVRELRKCQAGHRKPVVYVAGRFRSADGWKINENVFAAEKAGRAVAALGAMPLIPHSIGAHMAGTEDDSFWLTGTLELMRRCDVVLVLPGYQESQGTQGEIAEAQRIGLPVIMPQNGAPGWDELRSWLKKPRLEVAFKLTAKDTAQPPTGVDLVVDGACLYEGQTLLVERKHEKAEVAIHAVDESGESYIWLKDDSAVCKLISALSLVAESDMPVALMAEIAEKWQTKRLINARDQADQMLAELGIELGQRDGETLLAAARRVRETGTYAEVERLNKLCDFYLANMTERANQLTELSMALGEHDGMTDLEAIQAVMAERDTLRANKEAFSRDATRVRLALESEVKDLKDKLGASTAELGIIAKGYDEALELCDRDGMTPAEQIKELRKELEDIRPEAEQMAGWRQSSLNRQVEVQNLQAALAEEKKKQEGFVASLCAELGVQGGERTMMVALEQFKLKVGRKAIVIPHRMEDMASAGVVRALPLLQPCDAAPNSEASHITQAGEAEVKKALTRPADSSCTCHLDAPCSHCTWYSDRGLDDPNEVGVGLVMQD